jgi:peptidoglycan/LPS O-acetylase OafA/YrhL
MLPNLGFAIVMEAVPNLGHLWSIGVEEQFYLMWPLLLKFAKKPIRTIFIFLAVVLSIKVFVMVLFTVVYPQPYLDPDLMIFSPVESLKRFIGTLKFEAMAIGGLGACMLFYKKEKLLAIVYSRFIQIAAYISIPVIVLFTPKSMYTALYLFFSVPFLIIILNVATNERSIFKLRSKVFDFLGRISFGIYMYHLICIAFAFHVLDYIIEFPALLEGWHTLLLYLVSIPLTIGVSSVSYFYFEKKFIQRKRKYTTVVSGDDAR